MAEFCPTRTLEQTTRRTRLNCLTAGHVSAAMLPLDYETDREMLAAALATIGLVEPPKAECCGSPTRWTWARWNARRRISTRPASERTWRSCASRGRCRSTQIGNLPHGVGELAKK